MKTVPVSRSQRNSPYYIPPPPHRQLRIFSLDPSLAASLETAIINTATVEVPWETDPLDPTQNVLKPGPKGEYLEVIDYDPASGVYYKPVDLNDPYLLAQDGLPPSDGNPQFHQQMVYAVAMRTIRNFERALGRRALWSPRPWKDTGGDDPYVPQLRIYPHALREANAYYSPAKKALLFGYFRAGAGNPTQHLPGGNVFTCLSHDIIAHETAHALLDGMHRRFTEPTNPDVLALHEAFGDIVALFQHFSFPEVLRHVIGQTRGELGAESHIVNLAHEFGKAIGRTQALRSAISVKPDVTLLETETEPHRRGSILVAAVFDAFLAIYRKRIADLVRLASNGTGVLPEGAIHPDLVNRLAKEAAKASQHVLTMCIRALDYLPPVDVTFGDYLRALITADFDLVSDDSLSYRVAFIEAFRNRGIYPRDVASLSEESLRWQGPDPEIFEDSLMLIGQRFKEQLQNWDLGGDRQKIFEEMKKTQAIAHKILTNIKKKDKLKIPGLDLTLPKFEVHAIRPVRRSGPDGQLLMDIVVEITQRIPACFDKTYQECQKEIPKGESPDFWYRGGCTLIIGMDTGKLRYCIYKRIDSSNRYERQKEFLSGSHAPGSLHATYFGAMNREEDQDEVFSFLHRSYEEEC